MTVAEKLATFISGFDREPQSARRIALQAVLDLMTAAIVGFRTSGGAAAREAAQCAWGKGRVTCWFSTTALTPPGAAFSNSAIASMLDLDDGHRSAVGHPGAAIIPAVLAAAQATNCDANRTLSAITLGYEVAVRVASARDINNLDTLVSGPWCGQGIAAAVGWLRRLSSAQIAQAIAIAGSTAPNLTAVGYSKVMGNHVKEGIPWATATGMTAVDLAAAGFTGPIDLLDNEKLFSLTALTNGLSESWLIESIYFKPYSCCRWAHAAIDGLLEIQLDEGIGLENIDRIEISTFSRALSLNNHANPTSLESAQYSIPFCVALAAVEGTDALLPLQEASLRKPDVLALSQRVSLSVDPKLNAMFPNAVPARVTIITTGGRRLSRSVIEPKGEATNPMSGQDLQEKFDQATKRIIDISLADQIKSAVGSLGDGDIAPLFSALATPIGAGKGPN